MLKTLTALAIAGSLAPATASATERTWRLEDAPAPGFAARPTLLLREQAPAGGDRSHPVLYVHGATFPSASSIMYRFEGLSWADSLNAGGFDVFGLDFTGYGGSDRYPDMQSVTPGAGPPLGRTADAADQVERAVRKILHETGAQRVSIIAHSWGTLVAGRFAAEHPELVDRLVLFGPFAQRDGAPSAAAAPPWTLVTAAEQHARFIDDTPPGETPVLLEGDFPAWAQAWLASDPESATRTPPSVKVPGGPGADIAAAWSGHLPYDPARVRARVLLVRGAWDSRCTDADAAWLTAAFTGSPQARDVNVPRAGHLMHLEEGRAQLYAATLAFLTAPPAE